MRKASSRPKIFAQSFSRQNAVRNKMCFSNELMSLREKNSSGGLSYHSFEQTVQKNKKRQQIHCWTKWGSKPEIYKRENVFFFLQKPRIVGESRAALKLWYISGVSIPDNCYGHHGRCPCKNILSGVTFSRLNTKTAYILLFMDIFECFGVFLVNFWV